MKKKKIAVSENNSRRKFIQNTVAIAAGFYIIPRHALGRGFIAPSDRLIVAGIGAGGKGEGDLNEFFKSGKACLRFPGCGKGWRYPGQ